MATTVWLALIRASVAAAPTSPLAPMITMVFTCRPFPKQNCVLEITTPHNGEPRRTQAQSWQPVRNGDAVIACGPRLGPIPIREFTLRPDPFVCTNWLNHRCLICRCVPGRNVLIQIPSYCVFEMPFVTSSSMTVLMRLTPKAAHGTAAAMRLPLS